MLENILKRLSKLLRKYLHTHMFSAELVTVVKKQRSSKYPSVDKTKCVLYMQEENIRQPLKGRKVTHVPTWMNFDGIVLNEKSQSSKHRAYDSIHM